MEDRVVERQISALAKLVVSVLFLAACTNGGSSMERKMFIEHYKSSCQGVAYQTCLLTRESELSPWDYFYDGIEGFEYEWGYRYELRVLVVEVPDPPADASSLAYSLLEVLRKERVDVDTPFEFPLLPFDEFSQRLSDTEFSLGYENSFTCDLSTCDTVESLLTQQSGMVLEFIHANERSGPLRLQGVKCSDASLQFFESCL